MKQFISDDVLWSTFQELQKAGDVPSADKVMMDHVELVRAYCGPSYFYVPLEWVRARLITLRKKSRKPVELF